MYIIWGIRGLEEKQCRVSSTPTLYSNSTIFIFGVKIILVPQSTDTQSLARDTP